MSRYLRAFLYVFLLKFAKGADPISWLPCQFTDENITITKGVTMQPIFRKATLQFGQKGDRPVNPDSVTFLITLGISEVVTPAARGRTDHPANLHHWLIRPPPAPFPNASPTRSNLVQFQRFDGNEQKKAASKVNIRRSLVGAEVDKLTCHLQRYSTDGSHVRWPVRGEHEYNRWFTLRILHSEDQFNILAFIRQSTDQPPTGQDDYRSWAVIQDKDILRTSVAMMLQTRTPVVKSRLKSQVKLHCQFDVDHKSSNVTVRWKNLHGKTLFTYGSRPGRHQGSGVSLDRLAAGDATYSTLVTNVNSTGTYMCFVNVHPLQESVPVQLLIEEPPYVSLNVDSTLVLSEDELTSVVCRADGYYPLDLKMELFHQGITDVGPRVESAQFSSHKTNVNGTFRLSGSFRILPKLMDSGRKYTCSVSHKALSAPIMRNFTLSVTEPALGILVFDLLLLFGVMILVLLFCRKGKKYRIFWDCFLQSCTDRRTIY